MAKSPNSLTCTTGLKMREPKPTPVVSAANKHGEKTPAKTDSKSVEPNFLKAERTCAADAKVAAIRRGGRMGVRTVMGLDIQPIIPKVAVRVRKTAARHKQVDVRSRQIKTRNNTRIQVTIGGRKKRSW